jgi:hypothetical protein
MERKLNCCEVNINDKTVCNKLINCTKDTELRNLRRNVREENVKEIYDTESWRR